MVALMMNSLKDCHNWYINIKNDNKRLSPYNENNPDNSFRSELSGAVFRLNFDAKI